VLTVMYVIARIGFAFEVRQCCRGVDRFRQLCPRPAAGRGHRGHPAGAPARLHSERQSRTQRLNSTDPEGSESQMTCRKCGGPVESGGMGRPRRWCSDGCRKSAGLEVRRIGRRLERVEDQLPRWRAAVERGRHPQGGSLTHARERLADLVALRDEDERRLRHLLDDEGDHGG
jgi:hypothetical protein